MNCPSRAPQVAFLGRAAEAIRHTVVVTSQPKTPSGPLHLTAAMQVVRARDRGGDQVPRIAASRRVAGVHDHLAVEQVLSVRELPCDAVRPIGPLVSIAVSVDCAAPGQQASSSAAMWTTDQKGCPREGQKTNLRGSSPAALHDRVPLVLEPIRRATG